MRDQSFRQAKFFVAIWIMFCGTVPSSGHMHSHDLTMTSSAQQSVHNSTNDVTNSSGIDPKDTASLALETSGNRSTTSSKVKGLKDDVTNATASWCPVFPVVVKNETLHFQLTPRHCHMTVRVVRKPGRGTQKQHEGKFKRYIHLPLVEIKHAEQHMHHGNSSNMHKTSADVTGKRMTCPDYPIRSVGLVTIVDTVKGQCQIALGVRLKTVEGAADNFKKRFSYIPVYEYLDKRALI